MTDESDNSPWMPGLFGQQMQEAGEQVAQSQQELFKRFLESTTRPFDEFAGVSPMSMNTATFKARVQSGGRISIPEPERDALDIEEGDIVQTIVVPVKRAGND